MVPAIRWLGGEVMQVVQEINDTGQDRIKCSIRYMALSFVGVRGVITLFIPLASVNVRVVYKPYINRI